MADVFDMAQERAEKDLEVALAAQRAKPKQSVVLPVACMNECGEVPLPGGMYCCVECRDDHQERLAKLSRQGRV